MNSPRHFGFWGKRHPADAASQRPDCEENARRDLEREAEGIVHVEAEPPKRKAVPCLESWCRTTTEGKRDVQPRGVPTSGPLTVATDEDR